MSEELVTVLWVVGPACLSIGLAALITAAILLLLPKITYDIDVRRRARRDYRAARGTQHLRQLRTSVTALEHSMAARHRRIEAAVTQLDAADTKRAAELRTALSTHLVNTRLTEVPGIGLRLSRRIVNSCFQGSLRDLRFADRVSGVGPAKGHAIMQWAYAVENDFPRLLKNDFPGRDFVEQRHARQTQALHTKLGRERRALATRTLLQNGLAMPCRNWTR